MEVRPTARAKRRSTSVAPRDPPAEGRVQTSKPQRDCASLRRTESAGPRVDLLTAVVRADSGNHGTIRSSCSSGRSD